MKGEGGGILPFLRSLAGPDLGSWEENEEDGGRNEAITERRSSIQLLSPSSRD